MPQACTAALRSRGELPGRRHRYLRRRHDRRARPDLSARADRVHGRLAGRAWRAKSDRGGEARRRDPARPACVEFRRNLFGARCRSAAPSRWTTSASSRCGIGGLAAGRRVRARRSAEAGLRHRRSAGRRTRPHGRGARSLSHATASRAALARCVSRPSGGAGRRLRPALLAPLCRSSMAPSPRARLATRPGARRHSGDLRRQSHRRRRRQDADRDRRGADAAHGRAASRFSDPRLWRQLAGPLRVDRDAPHAPPKSATSRCCWRAPRRPSWRMTAWPARRWPRAAGATVIVMDDGFQNPSLAKDLVYRWWSTAGAASAMAACSRRARCARRCARSWRRAHALLVIGEVIRCRGWSSPTAQSRGLPVFHGRLGAGRRMRSTLLGRQVLAFAGIGDPEKFFRHARCRRHRGSDHAELPRPPSLSAAAEADAPARARPNARTSCSSRPKRISCGCKREPDVAPLCEHVRGPCRSMLVVDDEERVSRAGRWARSRRNYSLLVGLQMAAAAPLRGVA